MTVRDDIFTASHPALMDYHDDQRRRKKMKQLARKTMDQTTAASVELIKARKEYREADEALARATSRLNIAQRRVNELFHARTLAAGQPAGKEE